MAPPPPSFGNFSKIHPFWRRRPSLRTETKQSHKEHGSRYIGPKWPIHQVQGDLIGHRKCTHALLLVWLSSRLRVSGFRQARPRFDCHLLFDFSAHLLPRIFICTHCKLNLCWIWLLFSIPCKIYFLVFYQFGGLFSSPSSTLPTYSLKAIKFW